MIAPICLFTYNRLSETQQTIEALKCNYLAAESELYIFSDGAKNEQIDAKVEGVRNYLHCITGFKSVNLIESNKNKGLANSIIDGVTMILEKYDSIIVVEDDLISSIYFLDFMNQALDFYQNEENIQSINGYSMSLIDKSNDIYFQIRPGSWGWATWKDRWKPEIFNKENLKIEINLRKSILKKFKIKCGNDMPKMLLDSINNKNDSWYVRWVFDHFRNNHFSVFPTYSYIQNIGFNIEGTHCKGINTYTSELIQVDKSAIKFLDFKTPEKKITKEFLNYFSLRHKLRIRLELMKSKAGRNRVFHEIKTRMNIHL
jgi:hypothetical protein